MAEGLSVAMAARKLGLAPATLRTWDRRYGIGPSAHVDGHHRRYDDGDLAKLMHMRRLILSGSSPAQAAAEVLSGNSYLSTVTSDGSSAIAPLRAPQRTTEQAIKAITRAATVLDHDLLMEILGEELEIRGAQDLWSDVLVPVMVAVGEQWQTTRAGIEVEHTLSEAIIETFGVSARSVVKSVNSAPVLLASADEELHSLPLYALAAALARHQVTTRIVGSRTPPSALAAAMRRTGPAAVFIWSHLASTGGADQLNSFPTLRPTPCVIVGGPGWQQEALPKSVTFAASLDEAVTGVLHSLGLHPSQ